MKKLIFFKNKIYFIFFLLSCFFSQTVWAKTCLNFNLKPHKAVIESPFDVNEFIFSKSSQISEAESKLLFLDYSDKGNILTKHAFISCNEIMPKYFKCVAEEYNLSIDLSQKEPVLYFTSLMVSDYDQPLKEIKSTNKSHIKIMGFKKTCPIPDREQKVIEG